MLRNNFIVSVLALLALCLSACGDDSPYAPRDPNLFSVPERLALGATALASVIDDDGLPGVETEVTAADQGIVVIDQVSFDGEVRSDLVGLRGVGIGRTTIAVQQGDRRTEYPIEVARPTRFNVLLVDGNPWVAEGFLEGKTLLAQVDQHIVVTYYDPEGLLVGTGLADFLMPSVIGSECEPPFIPSWYDRRCWRPVLGPQSIHVTVDDQEQSVGVTAAAADDLVDLILVQTGEEDAQPGQKIRVDALGVTSDGTRVHGMHATAADGWIRFPIAYEYDPEAEPRSFSVSAGGLEQELVFQGDLTYAEPFWERP